MSCLTGQHRKTTRFFWANISEFSAASRLGSSCGLVYVALCYLENDVPNAHKSAFRASRQQIAEVVNISPRTVDRCLWKLVQAGVLEYSSGRNGRGAKVKNTYRLLALPERPNDAQKPAVKVAHLLSANVTNTSVRQCGAHIKNKKDNTPGHQPGDIIQKEKNQEFPSAPDGPTESLNEKGGDLPPGREPFAALKAVLAGMQNNVTDIVAQVFDSGAVPA